MVILNEIVEVKEADRVLEEKKLPVLLSKSEDTSSEIEVEMDKLGGSITRDFERIFC